MAVSQFEPSDVTRRLLELERESDIVIEMPITINSDGALRVTYVESDSTFQDVFRRIDEEAPLTFEVIETGSYDPDANKLLRVLTAASKRCSKQLSKLDTTVRLGRRLTMTGLNASGSYPRRQLNTCGKSRSEPLTRSISAHNARNPSVESCQLNASPSSASIVWWMRAVRDQ